jgi:hypothetical protein
MFYCFEGSIWQKMFVIWFVMDFALLVSYSLSPVAAAFGAYGTDTYYIWMMGLMAAQYAAGITLSALFFRGFFPKLFAKGKKGWLLCSLGAVLSRMVLRVITPHYMPTIVHIPDPSGMNLYEYYLVIFASLWCLMSILVAIWMTLRRAETIFELRQSHTALAASRSHYEKLSLFIEDARRLRHDIRYKEAAAATLAEKQDYEGLKKLFASEGAAENIETSCEHPALNALLGWYAQRFAAEGIRATVHVHIPGDIPIEAGDLCVLFGNLLENALEASRGLPESDRHIEVMANAKNQLNLSVSNGYMGIIKTDAAGLPLSAKESGGGYGLRSAAAVCEKYGGEFHTEWTADKFTALAMLNFSEEAPQSL